MFPVEFRMTQTLRYLYISYLYDRRQYYGLLNERVGTYRNVLKFGMSDIIQGKIPQFFYL